MAAAVKQAQLVDELHELIEHASLERLRFLKAALELPRRQFSHYAGLSDEQAERLLGLASARLRRLQARAETPHRRRAMPAPAGNHQQLEFDFACALDEIRHYHHEPDRPGFPYVTLNWRSSGECRMRQKPLPVSRIEWGIRQIATRPDWPREHWFISQAEFSHPDRQKLHLWRLGGCWVDIDIKSPDHDAKTLEYWRSVALSHCQDLGIPEPTVIVWSGHGLHVKWAFAAPLPAAALPRWNAVQRHLHAKMQSVGLPSDPKALDASRILRIAGTFNAGVPVQVLHVGKEHDFELFCDCVLPYTRDEVRQFRESDRLWQEARATWARWDENRRAAAQFLRRSTDFSPLQYAAREAAEKLHYDRLQALRRIAQARGGIQPGQRNEWCWILANSAAYGLGDPRNLYGEVVTLMREIAPSYTEAESRNSASSVYARLREGKDKLYRLKTSTILQKLKISEDEARQHGLLNAGKLGHGTKNPGALGLEKIQGLSSDEYEREVRRRFALGGQYSASIRHESALVDARSHAGKASAQARAQASEDKRSSARLMRARGMSLRAIAAELGVSVKAAWTWCK
jgi:hypothetical protein